MPEAHVWCISVLNYLLANSMNIRAETVLSVQVTYENISWHGVRMVWRKWGNFYCQGRSWMTSDLPYDSLHILSEWIQVNIMCNLLTFIQAGCVYDFLSILFLKIENGCYLLVQAWAFDNVIGVLFQHTFSWNFLVGTHVFCIVILELLKWFQLVLTFPSSVLAPLWNLQSQD